MSSENNKQVLQNQSTNIQQNDSETLLDKQSTIDSSPVKPQKRQGFSVSSKQQSELVHSTTIKNSKAIDYRRTSNILTTGLSSSLNPNQKLENKFNANINQQMNQKNVENIEDDGKARVFQGEGIIKEEINIIMDHFQKVEHKNQKVVKRETKLSKKQESFSMDQISAGQILAGKDVKEPALKTNMNKKYDYGSFVYEGDGNDFFNQDQLLMNTNQNQSQMKSQNSQKMNESGLEHLSEEDSNDEYDEAEVQELEKKKKQLMRQNQIGGKKQNQILQSGISENGGIQTEGSKQIHNLQNQLNQQQLDNSFETSSDDEEMELTNRKEQTEQFKELKDKRILLQRGDTFQLNANIYQDINRIIKNQSKYNIQVHSPEIVSTKLGLKKHVVYTVQIEDLQQGKTYGVKRRYKHFAELEKILHNHWPGMYIPPLPQKALSNKTVESVFNHAYSGMTGAYNMSKIDERTRHFEYFLIKIFDNKILAETQEFRTFITMPNEEHLMKYLKKTKDQPIKEVVKKYRQIFKIFDSLPITEEIKEKNILFQKWTRRVKLRLLRSSNKANRLKVVFNKFYELFNTFKEEIGENYQQEILEYREVQENNSWCDDDLSPVVFDELCDLMQNELYDILALEFAFDDIQKFGVLQQKADKNQNSFFRGIIKSKEELEQNSKDIEYLRCIIQKFYGYYFIDNIRATKMQLYQYLISQISKIELQNQIQINNFWSSFMKIPQGYVQFQNGDYEINQEDIDDLDDFYEQSDLKIEEDEKEKKKKKTSSDDIIVDVLPIIQPRKLNFDVKTADDVKK